MHLSIVPPPPPSSGIHGGKVEHWLYDFCPRVGQSVNCGRLERLNVSGGVYHFKMAEELICYGALLFRS